MTHAQRAARPRRVRGGYGYRHMCRFFSGPSSSTLPPYEYVWRLDSDSFLSAAAARPV